MNNKEIIVVGILIVFILMVSFASAGFTDWFGKLTGRVAERDTNISITVVGVASVTIIIHNATLIGSNVNPTENTTTFVIFNISMIDTDGVADLNDTSITANFSRAGESTRENITCQQVQDIGSDEANYTCTIEMHYLLYMKYSKGEVVD